MVVGAGLAGLVAARELGAAGAEVIVVEAQDRVGGRTWTRRVGGVPVEMGGQWIGPAQPYVNALARELGVETFPTEVPGRTVFYEGGSRSEYEEDEAVPFREPDAASEVREAFEALDGLAKEVPAGAPWTAGRAAEWDGQTLETWKLRHARSRGARFYIDLAVQSLYACEPRDISLLGVLSDVAASGGSGGLFEIEASAEESRFVGGAQELSVRVAEGLEGRVVLSSPVRRISQEHDGVLVESDAVSIRAGAVVVAVPPVLRGRIEYEPALPAAQDGLSQRMPMGAVIKCHAVYDVPFWRGMGLSGRAEGDTGPCRVTCDNTTPGEDAGVLTGFILGADARLWGQESADEREAAVLECFARYFGEEALHPRGYAECDWGAEVHARGGYAGVPVPGFFLDHGFALQEPVGRVHWAGTETASEWNGYMEGAVGSGLRAAREVLSVLTGAGFGQGDLPGKVDRSRGRPRAGATGTGG
ncbi:NAD(P)-binding protein [Rubrobacter tropicus]|uniref:NAD(P)-binding protein n=1 Tax=Rubrobacter tropicus TaxID=2653851 RepID=A0A6G8QFE3_9ACTN|nr:NAD(P)-binding protein [Rubrobacter tropicus]